MGMGEYRLKTNSGETIKKTRAKNMDDAIIYFALIKKLNKKQLLKIFMVEKAS